MALPKPAVQLKPAPTAPEATKRLSLTNVIKGKQDLPLRLTVFGTPGVGKSTFASGAPNPIFISPEEGTHHLDVTRFSVPDFSWGDAIDALNSLEMESHKYESVVIDTLDSLEHLNWNYICKRDGKKDLEAYGFNRGPQAALDEWRNLVSALERVWRKKNMHVILLGHAVVRSYSPATDQSWDRYDLNLVRNKTVNTPGLFYNWSDYVLFASYEAGALQDEGSRRVRGVGTGARQLHTQWNAAYEAKSRAGLPEILPLAWEDFHKAVREDREADPAVMIAEIERKAKEAGGEDGKKAIEAIARANGDASKLSQLNNWLNAQLLNKEASK